MALKVVRNIKHTEDQLVLISSASYGLSSGFESHTSGLMFAFNILLGDKEAQPRIVSSTRLALDF